MRHSVYIVLLSKGESILWPLCPSVRLSGTLAVLPVIDSSFYVIIIHWFLRYFMTENSIHV